MRTRPIGRRSSWWVREPRGSLWEEAGKNPTSFNLERCMPLRTLVFVAAFLVGLAPVSFVTPTAAQQRNNLQQMQDRSDKLYYAGDYTGSLSLLLQIMKALEARSETGTKRYTDAATNAGYLYKLLGRYDEAVAITNQVLAIQERILPPDDDAILSARFNLAAIYQLQGRTRDAEDLYKRLLAAHEQKRGPFDIKVASVLNDL